MTKALFKCAAALAALLLSFVALGQSKATGELSGKVRDASTPDLSEGVPYAVVSIPALGIATVSDVDGNYTLDHIVPAEYEVTVQSLGYETVATKVKIGAGKRQMDFSMNVADFRLDQVTVTAEVSKAGAATASKISRTAIEHMQANSLADVMALLPGADITDDMFRPDFYKVKTLSIRGGHTDGTDNGEIAQGTAIVLDGAPLSNSANLNTMSAALGGGTTGAGGVGPSTGIDLRTITTDNIESVEVIRGVASVEYGDATSGTVIVNAKAGKEPMTVRFNTNPNIYSIGATQGVSLGNRRGFINYGADYAYSVKDPREGYDHYQRATARLSYSNTFGNLNTTTTGTLTWTKDKAEPNPDDQNDFQTRNSRDLGLRFTTRGTYDINKGWFKNVKYNLAFNYTDRLSYYKDYETNADAAYSFSKIDGSVLSSIAGQRVYDDGGNEITNFDASLASQRSWLVPSEYWSEYNVYGKELNTYAKLVANFAGNIGSTNHHIIFGADWSNDGNVGKGKVFDVDNPPYRSVSFKFATQRERAYKDIPFLNKFGVFAEETLRAKLLGRELELVAGARYDKVLDVADGVMAPRLNASFEIIPDVLSVRGAYGINVKTPGIAYVYPDNAYFDMTNFDNRASTTVPDAQKFQVITTHVYDDTNKDLELATQTKQEVGLDLKLGQVKVSVTAFRDICHNAYTFNRTLDSYGFVTYNRYLAGAYPADGTTWPSLTLNESSNYILPYSKPGNNLSYDNKGVEFVIDFGRIEAIRTSFVVNGQYYDESSWNNGYFFWNNKSDGAESFGIYSSKISSGISIYRNIITNLIATHNIPSLGLVISMTANVNWRNSYDWVKYGEDDDIPVMYLDIADGQVKDFDKSWVADETSAEYAQWLPILRNEANGAIASDRRVREPVFKPVLCVNTNITKQFDRFSVSFFANNMFRSTPLQALKKDPGTYKRINDNTFFFGLQLTAKIF